MKESSCVLPIDSQTYTSAVQKPVAAILSATVHTLEFVVVMVLTSSAIVSCLTNQRHATSAIGLCRRLWSSADALPISRNRHTEPSSCW